MQGFFEAVTVDKNGPKLSSVHGCIAVNIQSLTCTV